MRKLVRRLVLAGLCAGNLVAPAVWDARAEISLKFGAQAQLGGESDEGLVLRDEGRSPGRDYIRVEVAALGGERAVPGFWRVKSRPGFTWVEGRWNGELYIPGFWRPVKTRGADWAWVPGTWAGRKWIPGRWRPARREGYEWIEGHWDREGEWIAGFWRPIRPAAGNQIWEPGYWGPQGEWVEGHWREESRHGWVWVPGEYNNQGIWNPGHWERIRANKVWVKGYWDQRGIWFPGKWVRIPERTNRLIPGHYDRRGVWVAPRWVDEPTWQKEWEWKNHHERSEAVQGGGAQRLGEGEQIENYRRAREQKGNPPSEGGQLRQLGGSSASESDNRGYRGDRDNRGYREDRDNRGYREDRDNRGYREDRDNRGYREDRDNRGYREEQDAPAQPSPTAEPQPQPGNSSNHGKHYGWDKNKKQENSDQDNR